MDDDRTVGAASALFVRYLNQPSVRTSPIYIYALMGNWISSLPPVDATMALSISSPRSTSLRVFFSYFPFFFVPATLLSGRIDMFSYADRGWWARNTKIMGKASSNNNKIWCYSVRDIIGSTSLLYMYCRIGYTLHLLYVNQYPSKYLLSWKWSSVSTTKMKAAIELDRISNFLVAMTISRPWLESADDGENNRVPSISVRKLNFSWLLDQDKRRYSYATKSSAKANDVL